MTSCAAVELSPQEQAFLDTHPRIVLGTDRRWAPFVTVDAGGNVHGYDRDVLSRVNQLTGANFVLDAGDWAEQLERARSRDIDGLSSSSPHPERTGYLAFSSPYMRADKTMLVPAGNPLGVRGPEDLQGRRIGVQKGNLFDRKLAEAIAGATVVELDNLEAQLRAAKEGQIDAMPSSQALRYTAISLGLPMLEAAYGLNQTQELVFSVRTDWPEALTILNKGLAAITSQEFQTMRERWLLAPPRTHADFSLAADERQFLNEHGAISMCVDPMWAPLERLDAEGNYRGLFADYYAEISRATGLQFRVVATRDWAQSLEFAQARLCDMVSAAVPTPARKAYLNFTAPLLSLPAAVVTRAGSAPAQDFSQVADRTFAVTDRAAAHDFLRLNHPTTPLLLVSDPLAGLRAVQRGTAYAMIDALPTVSHEVALNGIVDLQVNEFPALSYPLSAGVRTDQPVLLRIVERAAGLIGPDARQRLLIEALASSVQPAGSSRHWARWAAALGGLAALLAGLAIAQQARLRSAHQQRLQAAGQDPVTGVNSRGAQQRLLREAVTAPDARPSVVLVSIDHFKPFTAALGYAAGDRLLRGIAQLLREEARGSDHVGRWGSKTFLILCPDTTATEAERLAETIRRGVAGRSQHPSAQRPLTVSLGVAEHRPGDAADAFALRAEAALEASRQAGGDQLTSAP